MQKTKMLNRISLVLFSSLLLVASSCKKDDKPNPQPEPQSKLTEYKDGEDFVRFQYNTDGTIKKATVKNEINTDNDIVDFTLTYNDQKVITEMNSSSGEKIVPVYANGVLERADIFMAGERTGYTNYVFENGYMKKATIYVGSGVEFEPILEFDYNYNANGNVTQGVIMIGTDVPGQMLRAGHVNLQHDTKTNPLFAFRDFFALLWQGPSKNNVTVEDVFDENQVQTDKNVYTYNYNIKGFPNGATVKSGLPGQPQTESTVGFVYQ
ncbi:hypothetical protein [Pollutibacter soli]|uniref:hypothetical protein n=1 Tax=Pollutibacter soli TaxID=3034157 RepID=UPI0030133D60